MWWDIASTTIHILSGDLNIRASYYCYCWDMSVVPLSAVDRNQVRSNHVYGSAIMSIQYFIMLNLLANSISAEESDLLCIYCYSHTDTFTGVLIRHYLHRTGYSLPVDFHCTYSASHICWLETPLLGWLYPHSFYNSSFLLASSWNFEKSISTIIISML